MNVTHYEQVANLFAYPDASFPNKVGEVFEFLKKSYPAAAQEVQLFYEGLPKMDLTKMQELFTRSFDVQAITTLDVGYVLFGDDYKRGEILSQLNREHKNAQNDCGKELADHLPNLLRLIAKLGNTELVRELVSEIVAPALWKMIGEFNPDRLNQKTKLYKKHYKTLLETAEHSAVIYVHALKALFAVLEQDFQIKKEVLNRQPDHDFIKSVSTEMSVEKLAKE
jgi:nitrate reductase assembly molybdenum cofactor insertion protein NarJ